MKRKWRRIVGEEEWDEDKKRGKWRGGEGRDVVRIERRENMEVKGGR